MIKIFGRYNIECFEQLDSRYEKYIILDYTCNLFIKDLNYYCPYNNVVIYSKNINYINPMLSCCYDIEIVVGDHVMGIMTFLNIDDHNLLKCIRSDGTLFEKSIDELIPVLIYDYHVKTFNDKNHKR